MEILQECEPCLERFGGHVNAAGFSIRKENLEVFHDMYTNACEKVLPRKNRQVFKADIEVTLEMLTPRPD